MAREITKGSRRTGQLFSVFGGRNDGLGQLFASGPKKVSGECLRFLSLLSFSRSRGKETGV